MKNLLKSVVAVAALAVPSLALAASWEIDSGHSSANFTVKHMMMTNVKGEFSKVTGNVTLDEKDVSKSSVNATIDASTIDTGSSATT